MAEFALKDSSDLAKSNGNGKKGGVGEASEKLKLWASTTRNPEQALRFYDFYVQELGLAPEQARFWAEDSVRIDREVQSEFTT